MTLEQFHTIVQKLKTQKLGGIEAQFKIAPSYRIRYELDDIKSKNPVSASVLMILFPDDKKNIRFILTKRPDYSGYHANQISFTGGKITPHDDSLRQAAIRETHEEIGLQIFENQIIKTLTEVYIPPSNFLVQPYMAFIDYFPKFVTNYEVEKILTPALSEILSPEIVYREVTGAGGKRWNSPGFILENEFVWGATAMMLSEIRELFIDSYTSINS